MVKAPALFLSHGSPMRVLENTPARAFLQALPQQLPDINGAVIISPHWETPNLQYTQQGKLQAIYDFWGFPPELSEIHYEADNPVWLQSALEGALADIPAKRVVRGLDHGAWSVLYLMYPAGKLPTIGLSLPQHASLEDLYALGERLASLREQGIMIITTGMATHNLRLFDGQGRRQEWANTFTAWLQHTVAEGNTKALLAYRELAPFAEIAHPRDEHLRPLFIALGAAKGEQSVLLHDSWEYGTGNNSSWAWGLAGE